MSNCIANKIMDAYTFTGPYLSYPLLEKRYLVVAESQNVSYEKL